MYLDLADAQKLHQEYPHLFRFAPRSCFAVLVIDRSDSKVKILEFPLTVYREIGKRFDVTKISPGDKANGEEWKIKATGKGVNTTYTAVFIDTVPLTEEEIQKVKDFKAKKDLPAYYPSSSFDEVVEQFGLAQTAGAGF